MAGGGEVVTHGELDERSCRLARLLWDTFIRSEEWLDHRGSVGRSLGPPVRICDATAGIAWRPSNAPRQSTPAELPRLPTGKLYKRLLRDRYRQGRDVRI
jgi:hypothetical protein